MENCNKALVLWSPDRCREHEQQGSLRALLDRPPEVERYKPTNDALAAGGREL